MTENPAPTDGHTAAPAAPFAMSDEKPLQRLYQKPAGEFRSKDLDGLKSLEEGWFVEFKDRVPDTAKLARSLSSFANSRGGLLVIGAKEDITVDAAPLVTLFSDLHSNSFSSMS